MNRPNYDAPDNNQTWFIAMSGALREAPCLFDGNASARRRTFRHDQASSFRDRVGGNCRRSVDRPHDRVVG